MPEANSEKDTSATNPQKVPTEKRQQQNKQEKKKLPDIDEEKVLTNMIPEVIRDAKLPRKSMSKQDYEIPEKGKRVKYERKARINHPFDQPR